MPYDNNDLANMEDFQAELDIESNTIYSVLNAHAMDLFSEYTVPKMAVTTKIINTDYLMIAVSHSPSFILNYLLHMNPISEIKNITPATKITSAISRLHQPINCIIVLS